MKYDQNVGKQNRPAQKRRIGFTVISAARWGIKAHIEDYSVEVSSDG
jgi:hypothetical protein